MSSLSTKITAATAGMRRIPEGSFLMGSDSGSDFEAPVHEVALPSFEMDETPVTNHQFGEFVAATGYRTTAEETGHAWGYDGSEYREIEGLNWRTYATQERSEHPVVLTSWYDADAFARWAGKRLPTEAEWERTARGGLPRAEYPWGNGEPSESVVGFARPAATLPGTSPVGSYPANALGLYDMVGNVWQWCGDIYQPDYYSKSPTNAPAGPWHGTLRVRRGGAWNVIQAFRLRCSNRGAMNPAAAAPNMGFRCAR